MALPLAANRPFDQIVINIEMNLWSSTTGEEALKHEISVN